MAWVWLAAGGEIQVRNEALEAVCGNSMTLARAALVALQPIDCKEREMAMKNFYDRWKDRAEVLDTWFSLEASIPRKDSLKKVEKLLNHPRFDPMAPNAVRALLGGFVSNTKGFHAIDGSGYDFLADQIIGLDRRNPITASRLVKSFCRWRNYIAINSQAMSRALITISNADLSANTREVIELILSD